MIVDFHTHLFSDEVRQDRDKYRRLDPTFGYLFPIEPVKMIGAEELIAVMDKDGVDRSVVCGFPWSDLVICRAENDYLLEAASCYPGRIVPFITVPPQAGDKALEEIERCMVRGAKGLGEMAPGTYGSRFEDLKVMAPLMQTLEGLSLPILIHTNETVGHNYPGKGMVDLRQVYQFVQEFPGVDIILAHWGGGFLFYELMPEVAEVARRVYYDTAASPFLYSARIYSVAVDIVGPEKILFGSDYPLIDPRHYLRQLERAELSKEDKAKILGENGAQLLGLSEEIT